MDDRLDGLDALNLWNLFLEDSLHAVRERHLRHRAAGTCTDELDLDYTTLDVDEFDIAAISLQCRPDAVEYLLHALSHRNSLPNTSEDLCHGQTI